MSWGQLEIRGLRKRFGETVALDDATFSLSSGGVHGLVGQNGAGKSTLVKILSGLLRADAGTLDLDGHRISMRDREAVTRLEGATAYQELTLIPELSVGQNLVLGREQAYGATSFRRSNQAGRELLSQWGVEDIDPAATVGTLSLGVRQRIEIVRALARARSLLLLDEPTSALTPEGVAWLKAQIRRKTQDEHGCAVVIITHRLLEIEDLCGTVTVLRDGRSVASLTGAEATSNTILDLMLGESMRGRVTRGSAARSGSVVLRVSDLRSTPAVNGVSFELSQGEVLGVAALEGHGQKELFLSLFGVLHPTSGNVEVNGKARRIRSPSAAIRSGVGICLVPEDRKVDGLALNRPVHENISAASLSALSRLGLMSRRRELNQLLPVMQSLNLDPRTYYKPASSLSGGNQQKVVLAKWLLRGSNIMLMYDPLRGIDGGAKGDFFDWMTKFREDGGSILLYSSDIEELIHVCDRIMVLYRGEVVRVLPSSAASSAAVLASMLGTEPAGAEEGHHVTI